MVNKKDLEMLEEEVVNATSLKEFSPLGYCFCHYIENFSDYTVKQFLKNCTLQELLEMEKDYLESWELVFHRQSFKKKWNKCFWEWQACYLSIFMRMKAKRL